MTKLPVTVSAVSLWDSFYLFFVTSYLLCHLIVSPGLNSWQKATIWSLSLRWVWYFNAYCLGFGKKKWQLIKKKNFRGQKHCQLRILSCKTCRFVPRCSACRLRFTYKLLQVKHFVATVILQSAWRKHGGMLGIVHG